MAVHRLKMPITRFGGSPATEGFTGDLDEVRLLAGESLGPTNAPPSAEEIVETMMADAAAIITGRLAAMTAV
jgi:hypothetical protein